MKEVFKTRNSVLFFKVPVQEAGMRQCQGGAVTCDDVMCRVKPLSSHSLFMAADTESGVPQGVWCGPRRFAVEYISRAL